MYVYFRWWKQILIKIFQPIHSTIVVDDDHIISTQTIFIW